MRERVTREQVHRQFDAHFFIDYALFSGGVRRYVARSLEDLFKQDPDSVHRRLFILGLYKEEYAAYEDMGAILEEVPGHLERLPAKAGTSLGPAFQPDGRLGLQETYASPRLLALITEHAIDRGSRGPGCLTAGLVLRFVPRVPAATQTDGRTHMAIGVGILGFAHGHVNSYCAQWQQDAAHGIDLLAAWDHDAARLATNAQAFGIQGHADLDEFLARRDIQAVMIAAETSLHADVVERAAAAGKMIALQKPLALTMPQADRIVAAVQRHGVPFTMAWQMRVDPQNVEIKELLHSGALGKVFMVRRRHGLPSQLWDIPSMWHFNPELNRDIWADDAAHPIDFLHWLLGVPETVVAEVSSLLNPAAPNDNGIAIFRYPGGLLAEVVCSFTCLAAENTVEVVGEKGSLIQNYGDVPSCNVPRPADACGQKWYTLDTKDWTSSSLPSPAGHGPRIAGLSGPLAEFFHGRRPPIASAEEGRTSLRMVLATYVATREGRRVRLDDPAIALV